MRTQENKKIHFKRNLKEYFNIVSRHKWIYFTIIFMVALTEILAISDKYLYKWFVDDAEKFISGNLLQNAFVETLILITIIYLGIVAFKSFFSWMNMHLVAIIEPKLIYDLKEKYFNHIINLSHKFHSEHKTGKIISRLGRGSSAIESMTDVFVFQTGPIVIQFLFIFGSIAIFTIKSAIVLFIIVAAFISYSLFLQNKQKKLHIEWNKTRDAESGFISDALTNVESIKYFGSEDRIQNKFQKYLQDSREKSKAYWDTFSKMTGGQQAIIGFGLIALIYFPIVEFLNKEITLGTVVFIYALYGMISGNLFRFMWGIRNFYRSMGDMEDLFGYGELENEIKDKPHARKLKVEEGSIEFEDVGFGFEDKNKIFEHFNLKIKPNEKIALVGKSGSGKTTVVKLVNRLYDVNSGKIKIDGQDIREFKQESLRSETGIVPQEPILFDDTIYNNIKFARPSATKKEIINAIKLAQLEKIIKTLPNKENTIVGERGVKLSGGEKQRVSIARAILANKKILVLDEATSALDSQTEHDIQKALEVLLQGRTSIIIAHRLSTIMNADRIIVLDKGKIVEQGSHQELLKKNGKYCKLWNLQSGGYIKD